MKCNAVILRHKKSGKIAITLPPEANEKDIAAYGFDTKKGIEHCDGEIHCIIEAVDEPYFGGSSAKLEVTFKCNKCGNTNYPHRDFPNEYNINKWINEILSKM